MKNDKAAVLIAALVMLFFIGSVSMISIKSALRGGHFGMPFAFSIGGRAKLRNTIEIPLEEIDSLKLEYGSKNIRLYSAEDDKVTVKEYLYSDNPKALAEVSYGADNEVRVTGGSCRSFVIFGFFAGEGERIEVFVPEKSLESLSVRSKSGNITSQVDGAKADGIFSAQAGSGNIRLSNIGAKELSVQTGSGNIKAAELTGESVFIEAGSGNVDVERLTGENVRVGTGSGNVSTEELTGKDFNIETGSGNVTANVKDVTGDMELHTSSGNLKLELPGGMNFHFNGNTGSGNIRTDFDEWLSYDKRGRSAEGDVGEAPKTKITAVTSSGNMHIVYR